MAVARVTQRSVGQVTRRPIGAPSLCLALATTVAAGAVLYAPAAVEPLPPGAPEPPALTAQPLGAGPATSGQPSDESGTPSMSVSGAAPAATDTENDAEAALAAASTESQRTVVAPIANIDPDAGSHTTGRAPEKTSCAVGGVKATTTAEAPYGAAMLMSPGAALRTGAVVSRTVTLKDREAAFPLVSVAEQLTAVSPSANTAPDAGTQVTTRAPSTASAALGAWNVMLAPAAEVASSTRSAGTPVPDDLGVPCPRLRGGNA